MTERFTKTKIICTIGPATATAEKMRPLVQAGMDIARLNFSHGTHEEHAAHIKAIRNVENELGQTIPILADLGGPKLRLGKLEEEFEVFPGDEITISTEEILGNRSKVGTNYSNLSNDVNVGDIILIDDGYVTLEVKKKNNNEILCKILDGGMFRSRKGINLPGITISAPTITEKDMKDIDFALSQGVDFFALSFVRSHKDVIELRKLLSEKESVKPIIVKIEKPEAIDDIDAIIREANAVMIARGDLGVEMPTEEIPILQKMIIEKCKVASTPVITATQMLESMVTNALPTRAEASDTANAVFDGTDAVMLSAETSIGKHPVEAVSMMNKIITRAEKNCTINPELFSSSFRTDQFSIDLSKAACMIAQDINASAIFAITKTGRTARHLSKYRVQNPIYAFTSNEDTLKFLTLIWGVKGLMLPKLKETDETLHQVKQRASELELISENDIVVFVAGIPLQSSNEVNMIKLDKV